VDSQFLAPPGLESFNILTRTHHQTRFVNALFADGHVEVLQNVGNRYGVDLQSGSIQEGFERILQVFENADAAP
jgi:prepilin-type processing-associated H-X9-DG protein